MLEELREHGEFGDFIIYDKLVYGNSRKGIPQFSNYKIGFQITESFIENNPNSTIIEWTKLGSNEIISRSEYSDLLP